MACIVLHNIVCHRWDYINPLRHSENDVEEDDDDNYIFDDAAAKQAGGTMRNIYTETHFSRRR